MLARYAGLPFAAALGMLAALTIVGIFLAFALHHGGLAFLVVVPVGALAGLYLYGYAQRPLPEPPRRPAPAAGTTPAATPTGAAPEEALLPLDPNDGGSGGGPVEVDDPDAPFVDPVEEADRLDQTPPTPPEGPPPPSGGGPAG